MHSRKLFALFPILAVALVTAACSLTGMLSPAPTQSLFATATLAPTQALIVTVAPTVAASTTAPVEDSTVPPVKTTAPEPIHTTVPAQPNSPTPPPTVTGVVKQATATTSAPTAVPSGTMTLKIYMIAMQDNGASGVPVGCGDSAVPVSVQVPRTQAVLQAALTRLLSQKSKDYGMSGLYNALYQSNLAIDSLAIVDGKATIKLTGQLRSGGVCDDPRIIAQLEQTALQFSTVQRVTIYVNGKLIQDLLSGRG